MTVSIFPQTHGDLILDLRLVDGNPALVAVDASGAVRPFGKVLDVRDGGGHVELTRHIIGEDIGFDREDQRPIVHD